MKIVSFLSWKGGTGRTTLVANLAALLARAKPGRVLAIDLDARNQLGTHFGLPMDTRVGLASAVLAGASLGTVVQPGSEGLFLVPFGETSDADRERFERLLQDRPGLLRAQLSVDELAEYQLALVDATAGPSRSFDHALTCSDVAVVVMHPDAASFATLPALRARLERKRAEDLSFGGAFILVNEVDESRKLGRDLRGVLAAELGDLLLPGVVHHDEAVREALAVQRSVVDHAPRAQATADLRLVAEWLWAEAITRRKSKAA